MKCKLNNTFRLGLVGGLLQGLEAAYLGREAGYHVTVIDRNPEVPAMGLAHQSYVFDVQKEPGKYCQLISCLDAVLPTTEDDQTLELLERISQEVRTPLLHDTNAYAISSSKVRSNAFLANHDIPIPEKWPDCHFPVVVKPSRASGSHGVQVVGDRSTLDTALSQVSRQYGEELVIEAYHEGPSLSLEVIARKGVGANYVVTELEFDDRLDCKRVYAPSRCSPLINQYFEKISMDIARSLELNGLMDIEVIVNPKDGKIVVLEIDARFPSQTPMAVYHASGINLVDEWIKTHVMGLPFHPTATNTGCALLEHISVRNTSLEFIGETRLLPWRKIHVWPNDSFFGATVALTDYQKGKKSFNGTLIFTGTEWSRVLEKREKCLEQMVSALGLKDILDPVYKPPQH